MIRESDAEFGQSLRHGQRLATGLVAIVAATVTVMGAAWSLARSESRAAATAEIQSDQHRERVRNIAVHAVREETAAPMARLEVEVRQLRESVDRLERALSMPQQPVKRRPTP